MLIEKSVLTIVCFYSFLDEMHLVFTRYSEEVEGRSYDFPDYLPGHTAWYWF